MRLRHFVAAALTTVLVAPTALLTTTAPAHAATATQIVGGTDGKPWIYRSSTTASQPGAIVYGETLSLSIEVSAGGSQVYDGTLTVQRRLPGRHWKTVKTSSSAYLYDSVRAVGNATYRVLYSGTSEYEPSSAGAISHVQRKLAIKNVGTRRVVLSGTVSPKYHGKVTIFRKHGKKWSRYKTLRTNAQSHFSTPLPAPRRGRYYWKIELPGTKSFATTQSGTFYTYSA
ncbi:hypothetical protein [Nocardioides sp.]|uniref:hypothetical protein n=1 Tax=Nocardioides sp. TaxID=35761 RepID=UPI0037831EE0